MAEEIDTPGEGRVRALVTVAGNPVLSTPNAGRLDRALEGLDFMLSIDIYLNETTRHADLILPTTAPLERTNYDMVFHGMSVHNHAKWSPEAVPRPADARDSWEVLLELAARMGGVARSAVEDLALGKLLEATVGPGTPCDALDPDEARVRVAALPFPERMLDVMLRAGPYGDRFDDGAEGLSLAKLKAAEHGVDLGALARQLPESLDTKSGRVELAPDLLADDVARLERALHAPRDRGFVLIGRRQLRSNNSWMHNLPSLAKGRARCTLMMAPDDARELGLATGDRARVRSRVGEVQVPVEVTDELMPGVVSLPHGFGHGAPGARLAVAAELQPGANTNELTDELLLDELSGNAVLNGIPVEIARVAGAA
jgi:anaerobic selenocysteine-containing dehydrogenase